MTQEQNAIWRFFASVQLALITLFILAATSIIGTLIPQGQPPAFYVQEYGPELARLFQVLDIPIMYGSWWFVTLLSLFCFNLIVCSIERLPNVWRMVVLDNLATDPERLAKMQLKYQAVASLPAGAAAARVQQLLAENGWKKSERRDRGEGTIIFAQEGAWSRLGVYAVHLSILVIFAGAMIGTFFGFKASVMLPEGAATTEIYQRGSGRPIPLGFELRCNRFEISYYDNGMPKEYRSDLMVIDPVRETPLQKSIVVNDPLDYAGLTFYQSSYEPLQEFMLTIRDQTNGEEKLFRILAGQQFAWPDTDISFGIINLMSNQQGMAQRIKVWFTDGGEAEPSVFWMGDKQAVEVERPGRKFTVHARQLYATGLQVAKDPGVWTVYLGCALMLVGLYVAFFLSHQRLWVYITPGGSGGQGSNILVSGASNKNRLAFDRRFEALIAVIKQDKTLTSKEAGA